MNQEILDKFEERGLKIVFNVSKDGEAIVSKSGVGLKSKISQTGVVIFETINAIGGVKIDTIEVIGANRGLLLEIGEDNLIGTLFERTETPTFENLWSLLREIKEERAVGVKPEEKPRVMLPPDILDEFKKVLKEYLGDFADRIYQNQIKAQRINIEEVYEEDARRLIFALGKAAGMIIGPTKGKELTNKLLGKLK
ncbi:MAG: hypothetical protein ABIL70_05920 [candidate division WOR-3 bacterium]